MWDNCRTKCYYRPMRYKNAVRKVDEIDDFKSKDSLTVALLFDLRDRLKIKAAHWRRRNV